ncbi:MAG: K(+)/H(+) antiporter [Trizodia sp. TS-e1964]|nr:MAG: K(+)/H(+) antiporter [Trizodia sp. TS-e1964]
MSTASQSISSTASAAASSSPSPIRVAPQGGILEGANPSQYDMKNPIILFIIQAGIIIIFCRLLHYPLSRLRQPRVIAEVIGGIVLGPSVMGRIPGFQAAIFPTESMPVLNLVANLGLVLFLFLVGLEVDTRLFFQNWRVALLVGAAGMALPFGLGCAIAYGLYQQFSSDPGTVPVNLGVFMLFVGVAMAITAFPVLCRILTELKLLSTPVGIIVLSAGVGNDVVGWILLALCVALVNAGTGLTALYVLLICVGWVLFLTFAIRPLFLMYLHRTGSIQNGPTQSVVAFTLLLVLASAFFTGIIGVHPIFGGFLIGLICPHDGGFAIKLTEKLEDLVCVLFLPLYFALSGLSTNIGLLNDGITWAYVVGVIAVAFAGKILGGTLAARIGKLLWRESFTIGVLMSCKGLVELIVLNIGLQAKILSTRTFTIFVVMALITTFATTPLTSFLYPVWYQKKLESWKRGDIDWDGNPLNPPEGHLAHKVSAENVKSRRLLVYLRLDSLPSMFTFIALLGGQSQGTTPKVHRLKAHEEQAFPAAETPTPTSVPELPLKVHGFRLLELTERTSTIMQVTEADDYTMRDPVINAFRTFGQLNNVAVSGGINVVAEGSYAEALVNKAADISADLVLIPWSDSGSIFDGGYALLPEHAENQFSGGPHNQFVIDSLDKAVCTTAIFINKGFGGGVKEEAKTLTRTISALSVRSTGDIPTIPIADRSHHIFLPFFGGADDRAAVRFVLQLAQKTNITATILHVTGHEPHTLNTSGLASPTTPSILAKNQPTDSNSIPSSPLTMSGSSKIHPTINTAASVSSSPESELEAAFINSARDSLTPSAASRVLFESVACINPLAEVLIRARQEVGQSPRNAGDLVVLGRGVNCYRPNFRSEVIQMFGKSGHHEARNILGELSEVMLLGEVNASILVVQAAASRKE